MGVSRGTASSQHRAASRTDAIRARGFIEPEFRGRTHELQLLRSGLRSLRQGSPVRQLIIGEQGIGKSRLIAEALSDAKAGEIVVHSGLAHELESDRPFGPLIDALDLRPGSEDPEQRAIGDAIAESARRRGDAEQHHRIIDAIARLLHRRTAAAPIALVLEDIQWADRLTVAALSAVVAACLDRPLGIVLTRRMLPLRAPVDELFEQGRPTFARIELDSLSSEFIALLANEYLGAAPGPWMQSQIDGAGGNPAMLLALLQAWQESGSLRITHEHVEIDTFSPPPQMEPAVLSRLARLSDRCQDLLTVAAVFERPFGVAMLAVVAGRSVIDVLTDLREALGAQLLLEVAGVLSFRHELVRQIIYASTPASVRGELHRSIADALHLDRGSPSLIGHHQLRAAELKGDATSEAWPADVRGRESLRWELLSRTEREVALLVSRGLSNKQAGAQLQVSPRTVETHLAHVFAKLGIKSRVELAGAVGRAGLNSREDDGAAGAQSQEDPDLVGHPAAGQRRGSLHT
ncbi:MAG: helix-turn-helix transcriptional regulator [Candidatus Dormibacteria bacterium]